jgi:hypothetical protein
MAQLWREETKISSTGLVTRNVGRDPSIKPFVAENKKKMNDIGIYSCTDLRANQKKINEFLAEKGIALLDEDTLQLMKECSETTALNTGHIVFCAGPAELRGDHEYRIKVVHSTSSGKLDPNGNPTEGVQEYFRRFQFLQGSANGGANKWTRGMKVATLPEDTTTIKTTEDEEEDNDDIIELGDPSDDEDDDGTTGDEQGDAQQDPSSSNDELAGLADVEVLAARMCF